MDKRTLQVALFVGFLLGSAGLVLAAAWTTPVSNNADGTVLAASSGPAVNLTGNFDASNESGGLSSNAVQWNTSAGNASFSSSGPTELTISTANLTGTWTNATAIDATGADLTINPGDKPAVTVGGDIDRISFTSSTAADDGTVDFVYAGSSGTSDVTIRTAPADTELAAIDADTSAVLDVATSNANGVVTFTGMSNSEHKVVLQTTSGGLKLSNPKPEGPQSSASTTLSVDVNDSDMPNDSVTVDFYLDGNSVGSDTVTSNGTASTSISQPTAGEHDVRAVATDSYGQSTELEWTFGVPDELRIFNESDPDSLIDDREVTVQFFADNGSVYERKTNNGKVSFTGLPPDRNYVIEATTNGYGDRTIHLESLIVQHEIYLLNDSVTSVDVVFSLIDESNQFSPTDNTTLFVEKALNKSGNVKYRTITSDQFSATNEIPTTLEKDIRYRLRIKALDGDTRVLGAYTATADDQATLVVGEVTFEGGNETNPAFQAALQEIDGNRFIRIKYLDPANATDDLRLEVVNRTDGSVLRPNTSEKGPFGRYVESIPISSSKDNLAYNVSYYANRTGFEDSGGTEIVGDVQEIGPGLGLDGGVLSMMGFLTIFGVLGLTGIAYPRYAGIPTVAVAAGLVVLGIVSIHPLLISGAGVIALIFAVGGAR